MYQKNFEGDLKFFIDCILFIRFWRIKNVVHDILYLASTFESISFSEVRQKANFVVYH